MATLTKKENFMRLMRGECPAWVPTYSFGKGPNDTEEPDTAKIMPGFISDYRRIDGGKDIWGVKHIIYKEGMGASIPAPGFILLDDITKWRDVIKAPSLEGVDFEAMAKRDIERARINRHETALIYNLHVGFFQNLMAFMGFAEGLVALAEEPEECMELLNYICDFYVDFAERSIDYYKPDIYAITDDTATEFAPFISLKMYREMFLPLYHRQAEVARRRGIPLEMHNCGHCEIFVDDWIDLGIRAWNPAQTSNDLKGIKAKYGNRLAFCGAFDGGGELGFDDCPEEVYKAAVKETIDTYAPGGGFAWGSFVLGNDEVSQRKNRWIKEVVSTYGRDFYK